MEATSPANKRKRGAQKAAAKVKATIAAAKKKSEITNKTAAQQGKEKEAQQQKAKDVEKEQKEEEELLNEESLEVAKKEDAAPAEPVKDVTFADLGVIPEICDSCTMLGWSKPSEIQKETIPLAIQGKDIIGLAQTGSGKTGAFAIPILQALLQKPQPLFAVVLSPTRELAIQIAEQFEALGSVIRARSVVIVGGVDVMEQSIALAKKPHIICATPGRLLFHLQNTKGFSLKSLKYLVLDEADRLLNMDYEEEIDQILACLPKERHTYLFSATMTSKVKKLERASLANPVKISVSSKYSTVDTLLQNYVFVPEKFKDCYLVYLLNEFVGNSIIVFVATCNTAQRVALMLRNLGFEALPIHGKMSQSRRIGSLNTFKTGDRNILLATDVASRGLDIPSVDLIINYDIPLNPKDYIHRVGRTARAQRAGRAVSVVTQYDIEFFQKIEQLTGLKMEMFPTEREHVMLLLERVMEAQRFATSQLKEQGFKKDARKKRRGAEDQTGDNDGESTVMSSIKKRKGKPANKKRKF